MSSSHDPQRHLRPVADMADTQAGERNRTDAKQQRHQLALVLGMHRSGTSAVAGALAAAGAWAGDPDDLMPPHPENAFGYFERRATAETLDALLLDLGGTWSSPPLDNLQPSGLEPYRPLIEGLIREVVSRAPAGSLPLVKDPRLSLFASQLAVVLDESATVIVAVRHPLEVARSLLERDKIPISIGLALWELYNVSICSGLAGRPVHVVSYDHLLRDSEVLVGMLESAMGDDGRLPPSAYATAAGSLSETLRHQRVAAGDEDEWVSLAVVQLWRRLDEAAQALRPLPLEQVSLSPASRELLLIHAETTSAARATPAAEPLTDALAEIERLNAELTLQHGIVRTRGMERDALIDDLAQARQRMAESVSENDHLQAELAQREGEFIAGLRQVDTLSADLTQARDEIERLADELREQHDAVGVARAEIDHLSSELNTRQADLQSRVVEHEILAHELVQAREQIASRAADFDLLQRESAKYQAELAARTEEQKGLTRELADVQGRLAIRSSDVERLRDESAKYHAELTVARDRIAVLDTHVLAAAHALDAAAAERDAVAAAFTGLQRHMEELADDAATFRERTIHLDGETARIRNELESRMNALIAEHDDEREQLASQLEVAHAELGLARDELAVYGELTERFEALTSEHALLAESLAVAEDRYATAEHRLLQDGDRARGFLESMRSVVGDFHPDVVLEWLDEDEIVELAKTTREERQRLVEANDELLEELEAVNTHREGLVGEITAMRGSESWKIGRALTWPVRLLTGRR